MEQISEKRCSVAKHGGTGNMKKRIMAVMLSVFLLTGSIPVTAAEEMLLRQITQKQQMEVQRKILLPGIQKTQMIHSRIPMGIQKKNLRKNQNRKRIVQMILQIRQKFWNRQRMQ